MKILSAVFEVSAPTIDEAPGWALPEFAFIGRSNVGKSSLINLLTERRDLAKVSNTPGKTKLINFFVINRNWSLVDLPGYGYAAVGKKERSAFNDAVGDFLEKRRNLQCIFVLIDSRLPPQEIDLEFLRWLGTCGQPFVLVFTKADKQSASQTQMKTAVLLAAAAQVLPAVPAFFITSATTKAGRTQILGFIEGKLARKT